MLLNWSVRMLSDNQKVFLSVIAQCASSLKKEYTFDLKALRADENSGSLLFSNDEHKFILKIEMLK